MRKKLVNLPDVHGGLVAWNSLENTLFHQRPTTFLIAIFHGFSMPELFQYNALLRYRWHHFIPLVHGLWFLSEFALVSSCVVRATSLICNYSLENGRSLSSIGRLYLVRDADLIHFCLYRLMRGNKQTIRAAFRVCKGDTDTKKGVSKVLIRSVAA